MTFSQCTANLALALTISACGSQSYTLQTKETQHSHQNNIVEGYDLSVCNSSGYPYFSAIHDESFDSTRNLYGVMQCENFCGWAESDKTIVDGKVVKSSSQELRQLEGLLHDRVSHIFESMLHTRFVIEKREPFNEKMILTEVIKNHKYGPDYLCIAARVPVDYINGPTQ